MLTDKTVTVLVPTFRRPKMLRRAVESVLFQSYQDIQLIISDNHSCDETAEVLKQLSEDDTRINFFIQKTNIGMNANFNFLISKVKTRYFCMLTDDDYYENNFISDALVGFNNNKGAFFSVLSCPTITSDGTFIKNQLDKWPREGFYKKKEATHLFMGGNHPVLTAIVYKSEVLDNFVFDEQYGLVSDIPLLVNLSAVYGFVMSRKLGAYFVRHDNVISNNPSDKVSEKIAKVRAYERLLEDAFVLDGGKIKHIVLKEKMKIFGAMSRDSAIEGMAIARTINNPIRYIAYLHLFLLRFRWYGKYSQRLKKIYLKV